jgi:hypothetical protein
MAITIYNRFKVGSDAEWKEDRAWGWSLAMFAAAETFSARSYTAWLYCGLTWDTCTSGTP